MSFHNTELKNLSHFLQSWSIVSSFSPEIKIKGTVKCTLTQLEVRVFPAGQPLKKSKCCHTRTELLRLTDACQSAHEAIAWHTAARGKMRA